MLIASSLLILFAIGLTAYGDRETHKDFREKLGDSIIICDSEYGSGSTEYQNVSNWLESNTFGWKKFYATVPAGTLITGEKIHLIVGENWLVASSFEDGVFSLRAPTQSLEVNCESN